MDSGKNGEHKMSYWELQSSDSNANYSNRYAPQNIVDICVGNINSANGLNTGAWNRGLSAAYGNGPTSGIYQDNNADSYGNTNSLSYWKKYTYAKSVYSGAYRNICMRSDSSDGWSFTVFDKQGGNGALSNSVDHKWTSSNNYPGALGGSKSANWNSMRMIVNDTTFACSIKEGSANTNSQVGFFMLADLEYQSGVDTHHYNGSDRYCPTITMHVHTQKNLYTNAASTGDGQGYHTFAVTQNQYRKKNGDYGNYVMNTDGTNANYNHYYAWLHDRRSAGNGTVYGSIWPAPYQPISTTSDANGIVYPLIPVYFQPDMGTLSDNGNMRWGKLMNVYRTADDMNMGDVITVGTTRYRVMRVHKATATNGSSIYQNTATRTACYAFPEDNVAY